MPATAQLIELIENKHELLLRLRELGCRQAELVAAGDTTSLLKLLAVKQELIGSLQTVERALAPHYEQDPDGRTWQTPQARSRCAEQAANCNVLLREILGMERISAERITIRRNEVAEQLNHIHAASQVRSAYEANRRT